MNIRMESRDRHPVHLLAAMLVLALVAGTASVGHTQEPSSLVITAPRPEYTDYSESVREQMRKRTEIAIWMTRISVSTSLGMKLGIPSQTYRLSAIDWNKRG